MWWTEPESTTDHKHFTNKTEMRFWVVHINMECQNTSQRTRPLNSSHHHFWEYVWDTSKHHLWQCKFSSLNLTMCLLAVWTKYVNLSHHAFRVWQKEKKNCRNTVWYLPLLLPSTWTSLIEKYKIQYGLTFSFTVGQRGHWLLGFGGPTTILEFLGVTGFQLQPSLCLRERKQHVNLI